MAQKEPLTTLDGLEKKMTAQQIAEAWRLAREWKKVKP
jgi:hypothetical protein